MDFTTYQEEAKKTDQNPNNRKGRLIALLGLASEAADLLSEHKKLLRDGRSHMKFKQVVQEELGDVLWYLSTTATKHDISLNDLAIANLEKTRRRWLRRKTSNHLFHEQDFFDHRFSKGQRFPREFSVKIVQLTEGSKTAVKMLVKRDVIGSSEKEPEKIDGLCVIGNELTDNSHTDDGYRFHDVFHLAHAAVLGWSPVLRKLMGRKRKEDKKIDEVEDGARAIFTEEALLTVIFNYAQQHRFLKKVRSVDTQLLDIIVSMVAGLEVRHSPPAEWERAILDGYAVWRQVRKNLGGIVHVNMAERSVTYSKT